MDGGPPYAWPYVSVVPQLQRPQNIQGIILNEPERIMRLWVDINADNIESSAVVSDSSATGAAEEVEE
jgi:hypothetical protein